MEDKVIFLFNRQFITMVKRLKASESCPAAARRVISERFKTVDKRRKEVLSEYWQATGEGALNAMRGDFAGVRFLDSDLSELVAVAGHALPRFMYYLAWMHSTETYSEELIRCGLYAVQAAAGAETSWAPAAADSDLVSILESIAEIDPVEIESQEKVSPNAPSLVSEDPLEAMMGDSRIGKLAQSICSDISASGVLNEANLLDLMSPEGIDVDKIMKGVMGGGDMSNPLLQTIIEKVSKGVKEEMESGGEEGAMMEEAMSIFSSMTNNMNLKDILPRDLP